MKKVVVLATIIFSLLLSPVLVDAAVKVKGYFRKDGTYVQPHYRSSPDGNPYNNYSFPGNTNPYSGTVAPGNPETYLKNYYDTGGTTYTTGLTSPSYASPLAPAVTIPTLSQPTYATLSTAPEWVEYVGQIDGCAHVYDSYGTNLARLKAQ